MDRVLSMSKVSTKHVSGQKRGSAIDVLMHSTPPQMYRPICSHISVNSALELGASWKHQIQINRYGSTMIALWISNSKFSLLDIFNNYNLISEISSNVTLRNARKSAYIHKDEKIHLFTTWNNSNSWLSFDNYGFHFDIPSIWTSLINLTSFSWLVLLSSSALFYNGLPCNVTIF